MKLKQMLTLIGLVLLLGCAKEAVKEEPPASMPKKTEKAAQKPEMVQNNLKKEEPSNIESIEEPASAEKETTENVTSLESTPEYLSDKAEGVKSPESSDVSSADTNPQPNARENETSITSSVVNPLSRRPEPFSLKPSESSVSVSDSINVLYMIKPGDYLSKIALNEYGRVSVWRRIWRWNYSLIGDNPNIIYPYNELTLKKPAELANPVKYDFYEYTVQEGETLWDIAKKEYGNNYAWIVIVRDNFNTIGSDYDNLKSGTVLKLRTRLY